MQRPNPTLYRTNILYIDGCQYPVLSFQYVQPYSREEHADHYRYAYKGLHDLGYAFSDFSENIIEINKSGISVFCLTDMFVGMTQAISGPEKLETNEEFKKYIDIMFRNYGRKRVVS